MPDCTEMDDIARLLAEVAEFEARWNGLIDRLRVTAGIDQRNLSIAATAGEDAFIRLQRAIATPHRLVIDGAAPDTGLMA